MLSQETIVKIAEWRQKARAGTLTPDECKLAILALREDRLTAAAAAGKSRSSSKKEPVDSDALLKELEI